MFFGKFDAQYCYDVILVISVWVLPLGVRSELFLHTHVCINIFTLYLIYIPKISSTERTHLNCCKTIGSQGAVYFYGICIYLYVCMHICLYV